VSTFVETKKYSPATTLSPEILALNDLLLLKAASFDTFCLVAPQPQEIEKEVQLETVSIAEPLQNRQHAQNPNAVNSREQGKEAGRVRYGRR